MMLLKVVFHGKKAYRASVDTVGIDWTKTKYKVDDPCEMSTLIKTGCKAFQCVTGWSLQA
jgi:hypothetical protein